MLNLLWSLSCFVGLSWTRAKFYVNPSTNRIVDNHGRERIFHGDNVVMKTAPFVPITTHFDARYSYSEDDARLMASMGYNVIRLGVLWAGLEPEQGQYNMTYLDQVVECVNTAEKYGLNVVLDMHQDVFNRRFCGNGVPDWVPQPPTFNFPYPLEVEYEVDDEGYPSREDCDKVDWPFYHFSTSLSHSVGNLYKNHNGLLDKFALFWGLVAQTFAEREIVFGYEIMNEPWCGDIYQDPTLLIPGIADRKYLEPMYDRVASEIRKYDDEHIILFESVTWEVTGVGEQIGFTHPPGGFDYQNRSILAFHNSIATQIASQEELHQFKWKEIQRLGVAGLVTETGEYDGCLEIHDQFNFGWISWAFKLYGDWTSDSPGFWPIVKDNENYDCPTLESCLDENEVLIYARTYPAAVSGTRSYFHFNYTNSEAILIYQPDRDIQQPTELRVPVQWRYKTGLDVVISPRGLASWNFKEAGGGLSKEEAESTLEIHLDQSWQGEELSVVIIPTR